jgi:hypothetical protein
LREFSQTPEFTKGNENQSIAFQPEEPMRTNLIKTALLACAFASSAASANLMTFDVLYDNYTAGVADFRYTVKINYDDAKSANTFTSKPNTYARGCSGSLDGPNCAVGTVNAVTYLNATITSLSRLASNGVGQPEVLQLDTGRVGFTMYEFNGIRSPGNPIGGSPLQFWGFDFFIQASAGIASQRFAVYDFVSSQFYDNSNQLSIENPGSRPSFVDNGARYIASTESIQRIFIESLGTGGQRFVSVGPSSPVIAAVPIAETGLLVAIGAIGLRSRRRKISSK